MIETYTTTAGAARLLTNPRVRELSKAHRLTLLTLPDDAPPVSERPGVPSIAWQRLLQSVAVLRHWPRGAALVFLIDADEFLVMPNGEALAKLVASEMSHGIFSFQRRGMDPVNWLGNESAEENVLRMMAATPPLSIDTQEYLAWPFNPQTGGKMLAWAGDSCCFDIHVRAWTDFGFDPLKNPLPG